jgi:hypothetical protein
VRDDGKFIIVVIGRQVKVKRDQQHITSDILLNKKVAVVSRSKQ